MDETLTETLTEREKELSEKLGSRLLLIWLLAFVAVIELLVIFHVAAK